MHLPNGTVVQAFDGTSGWQIVPGSEQAVIMDQAQQKSMSEQADFDGPLIDYKKKGNAVEQMGVGELDGRKTYRVRVTLANGDVHFWEIDTETNLPFVGGEAGRRTETKFRSNQCSVISGT